MAFQLSDDIMDVTLEPGRARQGARRQDMKEGVYTLPVLLRAARGRAPRGARARSCAGGPPEGERLDRALEIVRDPATPGRRPGGRRRRGRPRPGARRAAARRAGPDGARPARRVPRRPLRGAAGADGRVARIRAARENVHKRGDLLPVLRGRPRGPDRRRRARRGGVRGRRARSHPTVRSRRSSRPTSAASTPSARGGRRARSATTSSGSCS